MCYNIVRKGIIMKKNTLFILLILCGMFLICGCGRNIKKLGESIEFNTSNCKVENEIDTHGGFLGDGEYFAKITCSKIEELSTHWKELPVSSLIDYPTKMKTCTGNGCNDIYDRFNIPNIKNGYYYFHDRHSLATNEYSDLGLNNRSSWNFTLAILDIDTNIIYYYELDT